MHLEQRRQDIGISILLSDEELSGIVIRYPMLYDEELSCIVIHCPMLYGTTIARPT